ncbi:hypothetical protein [Vibrio harveyi]|uniref:hypothetical protein n=1 Tax=Vibrio harveyi TaxID=669 RepID=UPI003CF6B40B
MTKENLTVEDWKNLYDSLVNSVGRTKMESILTHFILDYDNRYDDLGGIIESLGLTEDRLTFEDRVRKACQKLTNDELASLTFDAIALDSTVGKNKEIVIGDEVIDPDQERLRHTLMLLDVQVTGNMPAFVRDWHEDLTYHIDPLKYLKGESQSFHLSEDEGQDSVILSFSKENCLLVHKEGQLDQDQLDAFESISSELIKQIAAIAESNRKAAVERSKSDLLLDM